MAHIARLRLYPVKALDGVEQEAVGFTRGGALAGDRQFALYGPDGAVLNGKRTSKIHRLSTTFDPDRGRLTVHVEGSPPGRFDLPGDIERAEAWFETFFEHPVTVRQTADQGFLDRPDAGPSVVSTASIEAVASWFHDLTVEGVRRRLRANVEVTGVAPFWEDRFVGESAPSFVARSADGSRRIRFDGVDPCGRCVVPTRDPATGEPTPGFRERFCERRAASFPEWADPDAFPHDYTLMLLAQILPADREKSIHVGDEVVEVDSGATETDFPPSGERPGTRG